MIAIVATLKIQDGKNAEFEAACREHMANSRARQLRRNFAKSCTDPNTYKVLELYQDEAALQAHSSAPHQREFGGKVGPMMGGRPELEFLDGI